jgi:hypothetical protein
VPPTATTVPPTATPRPPTATPAPPTATPIPPTATPIPTATLPPRPGDFPSPYDANINAGGNVNPADCVSPHVGKLLTVCAAYDFQLILPKLIGFGNIPMKECTTVDIQSVPR